MCWTNGRRLVLGLVLLVSMPAQAPAQADSDPPGSDAPGSDAAGLDADDIVARLRAPNAIRSDVTLEDEWGQPDLSCTPITARGVFADTGNKVMQRPRLQLQVNFAFGSDELTGVAVAQLDQLGEALEDPVLAEQRFVLVGHTDAVGDPQSNLDLSSRRAAAVERYLVDVKGVARERLQARGCGESRLADPEDPRSPVNRRVEVVNAGR